MKRIVLALSACLMLAACAEDDAKRAVEAYGFTAVNLGGMPWFGCSDSDSPFYNHSFTAMAANGNPIKGVVCGGFLKGYTVRVM